MPDPTPIPTPPPAPAPPTGVDPICKYCGRPILGGAVYGWEGPYHSTCVNGPIAIELTVKCKCNG